MRQESEFYKCTNVGLKEIGLGSRLLPQNFLFVESKTGNLSFHLQFFASIPANHFPVLPQKSPNSPPQHFTRAFWLYRVKCPSALSYLWRKNLRWLLFSSSFGNIEINKWNIDNIDRIAIEARIRQFGNFIIEKINKDILTARSCLKFLGFNCNNKDCKVYFCPLNSCYERIEKENE